MANVFLKPARDGAGEAVHVRDPLTHIPLAVDGEWKTSSPYWLRRVRDKDVIDDTANAPVEMPVPAMPVEAEITPPPRLPSVSPA